MIYCQWHGLPQIIAGERHNKHIDTAINIYISTTIIDRSTRPLSLDSLPHIPKISIWGLFDMTFWFAGLEFDIPSRVINVYLLNNMP